MASECGFVSTQINNLLSLQGASVFSHFYKYTFLSYGHVLRGKMDMCRDVFKNENPIEVFVSEIRQFIRGNVNKTGVRSYLEEAFSSQNHLARTVRPDEIIHC